MKIQLQTEVEPTSDRICVRFTFNGRSAGVLGLKAEEWSLLSRLLGEGFEYREKKVMQDEKGVA